MLATSCGTWSSTSLTRTLAKIHPRIVRQLMRKIAVVMQLHVLERYTFMAYLTDIFQAIVDLALHPEETVQRDNFWYPDMRQ